MPTRFFYTQILIIVLFLCNPNISFGNILTEGPSINLVTPNSVTIVWKTEEPTRGSLALTNEQRKTIVILKEKSKVTTLEHQITLDNLKPETHYGYHILAATDKFRFKSEWFLFSTAVKQDSPFRFASLSDDRGSPNGVNVRILTAIMKKVKEAKPHLIIFEGDLISGYCHETIAYKQYAQWKKVLQPYWQSAPVYPGIGNHDSSVTFAGETNGEKVFSQEFTVPQNGPESNKGVVYSFDYGNSHFIALDSNDRRHGLDDNNRIHGEQLKWLEQDLAATKQLHKFVYLHDPAYPNGAHIGSSLDQHPEDRDKFLEVCNKYGVEIIFCGHEHNYDRWNLDSTLNPILHSTIYQVKNGTCGASIYKINKDTRNQKAFKDAFNYVLVDVDGPNVTVTAFDIEGKQIDQFTYNKP